MKDRTKIRTVSIGSSGVITSWDTSTENDVFNRAFYETMVKECSQNGKQVYAALYNGEWIRVMSVEDQSDIFSILGDPEYEYERIDKVGGAYKLLFMKCDFEKLMTILEFKLHILDNEEKK